MKLTLEQAQDRGHAIAIALERPPALATAAVALADLQAALAEARKEGDGDP